MLKIGLGGFNSFEIFKYVIQNLHNKRLIRKFFYELLSILLAV